MKHSLNKFFLIIVSATFCVENLDAMLTSNPYELLQLKKTVQKMMGVSRHENLLNDKLFALCREGTAQEIAAILEAGARIDVLPSHFDRIDPSGEVFASFTPAQMDAPPIPPLYEAARFGNLEAVKELAKQGASLDDPKVLALACRGCYIDLAEYLLSVQNVTRLQTNSPIPCLPIHWVCRGYEHMNGMIREITEHGEVLEPTYTLLREELCAGLKLFKKAGWHIDTPTQELKTALHIAARHRDLESIKQLILAGADVNAQDSMGNTPLHSAVDELSISQDCITVLLKAGANPLLLNKTGQTVFDALMARCDKFYHGNYIDCKEARLLLKNGSIFQRLPTVVHFDYNFRGNIHKRDVEEYKKSLSDALMMIAPICYGIFLPTDKELSASRARLGAFFLNLNRYSSEQNNSRFDQLHDPGIRGCILMADPVILDEEAKGRRAGFSYQNDLINLYLDHLRWGNPAENYYFDVVKEELIDYLVMRLLAFYRERLIGEQDSSVKDDSKYSVTDAYKADLKEAVKTGLNERSQGLKQFGLSPCFTHSLPVVLRMLASVYPSSSIAWRVRFLTSHSHPQLPGVVSSS